MPERSLNNLSLKTKSTRWTMPTCVYGGENVFKKLTWYRPHFKHGNGLYVSSELIRKFAEISNETMGSTLHREVYQVDGEHPIFEMTEKY